MKILIVNGSPRGDYSVTLQTCKYLQILNPEHEYQVITAGQTIKKLQRDFSEAEEMLRWPRKPLTFIIFFIPFLLSEQNRGYYTNGKYH